MYGSENGNTADLFCALVREQAAPQVTIEPFHGNLLNFAYFLSMFAESVEKKNRGLNGKIDQADQMHRILVKHFINDKPEQGYRNAMELTAKEAVWKSS